MTAFECIQTVSSVIVAGGVIFALVQAKAALQQVKAALEQAKLLREQITDARTWNKMSMAFSHLPSFVELNELEIVLNSSFLRFIDRQEPLAETEVKELLTPEHKELRIKLKNYFNMLEGYCAAINYGVIDSDVAKALYGAKLRRHFIEFEPYIRHFRSTGADGFMWEMESTLKKWFPGQQAPARRYGSSSL